MKQETQDRAREKIAGVYEERAFEMLALYSYWGNRYSAVEKQLEGMKEIISKAGAEIRGLQSGDTVAPEGFDKKSRIGALKRDCQDYEARVKGVAELANSLFKKAANFREEGVVLLEQVDFVRAFKFKTPEEIDADKRNAGEKTP